LVPIKALIIYGSKKSYQLGPKFENLPITIATFYVGVLAKCQIDPL
jgi:hypothetical protein